MNGFLSCRVALLYLLGIVLHCIPLVLSPMGIHPIAITVLLMLAVIQLVGDNTDKGSGFCEMLF
jgi:hypothetical protein